MNAFAQLDRKLLHRLADGPVWARSLTTYRPLVNRLLSTGHLQHCHPPGGKLANMIALSAKGAAAIGLPAPTDSKIDQFAERLSDHGDVKRAAQEIGVNPTYGRVLLQRIIKQLGWQAA